MMRFTVYFLVSLMIALSAQAQQLSIIPKPASIECGHGVFTMDANTTIRVVGWDRSLARSARIMAERLRVVSGFPLPVRRGTGSEKNAVVLALEPWSTALGDEGYEMIVAPERIRVTARSARGAFYALQTLAQMIPMGTTTIPSVLITDFPRFPWRGMHLDVSRHFFPKEFIKTYIDMLAMHKMNTFHWHLVDDQGWRIEIKKYPRLTEIGAWRVDRENEDWDQRAPQQPGEQATYGGFYTQDDVREIVRYAAERHVTIVPEIEMPAHCRSALAAYPELSCTGGPFTVLPGGYWPNSDIYCAGNEATFVFLEDVLEEILRLFPGRYIHVGGDEADRTTWEQCPKCQARIKREHLKNEAELQSYFIRRIERFLVFHHRSMIGWDEILEGGLAPEAAVMSWRGIDGGIAAARQKHRTVMTPGSHCYFDHYQGTPAFEPRAIGGYTTLKKVYSYEPIPDSLTADESKHILGAQANLWTEFIPTPSHAQYMALPRMAALSEVVWSPKETRDWNDFSARVEPMMRRYEAFGYNYARSAYLVTISSGVDSAARRARCVLACEMPAVQIRYTFDGSAPTAASPLFTAPLEIDSSATIRAAAFHGADRLGAISTETMVRHLASFIPVKYEFPYEEYTGGGDCALTDGLRGTNWCNDGRWQGFYGVDLAATIDLGEVKTLTGIGTTFLQNTASWIFVPRSVEYLLSEDGIQFNSAATFGNLARDGKLADGSYDYSQPLRDSRARFVKVVARNIGTCPDWHPGKGEPAWIFVDEIVIE